MTAEIN